ncbi:RHS repeat-associated core domain-containing protein [Anoxybacillus rupiensis]|uniref:RHS repeat-associated core domain-containing protein n=2 Tax=Anoxybacteroides rupiense TaxID=311460 RepID=A0ABD5IVE9_9BACL|nr:RHS repeat-associated core domain-containing protein [Anoxybacillus rupiensis]
MDLRYTYDVDGNIVTCFDGADSYTYDFANRLKSWTYQGNTVQYDYDASGNLKNPHGKTLTFNAANEIEGFTYDDAGNLLKDDRYQYTWDGEGRLLSVKDVNGNTVASFTYRPDGLRETKTVNGVTYHYHYDGSDLIRVTDDSGQTVWAFTWANGKPNTVTNANGDTFYYVTNYRGDVVRIIDENGATVANYSYDPWGKVLSVSENAAVAGQPLGYAGYYYDRETKLYYLQARYYDPETARFISRDPDPGDKDDPITQNAYTYANDNPVMLVDPDGNYAIAVGVYFIPGIEEVALLATGAVVLGGITYKAGSWIANKVKTYQSKKVKEISKKIPNRLKKSDDTVDIDQFEGGSQTRVNQKTGWSIERDRAKGQSHGGSYWKLKDKKGKRVATLDKYGKILRP